MTGNRIIRKRKNKKKKEMESELTPMVIRMSLCFICLRCDTYTSYAWNEIRLNERSARCTLPDESFKIKNQNKFK